MIITFGNNNDCVFSNKIDRNLIITQSFTAKEKILSNIMIEFGTFLKTPNSIIIIEILDKNFKTIFSKHINTNQIKDNEYFYININKPLLKDNKYILKLWSTHNYLYDTVAVKFSKNINTTEKLYFNNYYAKDCQLVCKFEYYNKLKINKRHIIGFTTRDSVSCWGGDLRALYCIIDGFKKLGYNVIVDNNANKIRHCCDFIFLNNACIDQNQNVKDCLEVIPYGIITFYEDFEKYHPTSRAMYQYCINLMYDKDKLKNLYNNIDHINNYIKENIIKIPMINKKPLEYADLCIANSYIEKNTILKDAPKSNPCTVFWNNDLSSRNNDYNDSFLKLTGLKKDKYILQVGRFELRKNQLSTILGTAKLKYPLVFIASDTQEQDYEQLVIDIIKKYRKYNKTYIISQSIPTQNINNNFKIIQMPDGKKLTEECLISAYQNAGLHLHPAFYELPGYTNLEAAYYKLTTITSDWGSLKDYCNFKNSKSLNNRFKYIDHPCNIKQIESYVKKYFGKKYKTTPNHPIFKRTSEEIANEIIYHLNKEDKNE